MSQDSRAGRIAMGFLSKIWHLVAGLLIIGLLIIIGFIGTNIYVLAQNTDNLWLTNDLANKQADIILVLGAGLDENGKPSPMLAERLDTAAELYRNKAGKTILLSGDTDQNYYDETKAMHAYLKEAGIPEDVMDIDPDGTNTYNSVTRTKNKFNAEKVIIVSQQYHLYRALNIADTIGLKAYGVPADQHPWEGRELYEGREFWARIKDVLQSHSENWPLLIKDGLNAAIDWSGKHINRLF
ncbi:vancomycin high temperature exclusion protein [Peptococcus simiae]|uniref:Vancomycin high temperature exclusion protein n=1 Tax=Peptococcus simiae TaxID=1643805 RepID=A0ABW9GZT9_9FIRM